MKTSIVIALLLTSLPVSAETLWLLNFNGLTEGQAPKKLVPTDAAEVSVTPFFEQPEGAEAGRTMIVKSDGPDGGMALELRPGSVQNGAGYITFARGQKIDSNTVTFEALVKPDLVKNPTRAYQILNNQPGGIFPQSTLSTDGAGRISFANASQAPRGMVNKQGSLFSDVWRAQVDGTLPTATWSHVAAVYILAPEEGGKSWLKLYINGKLAGAESFERPADRVPRYLGVGRYFQPSKGDSFCGKIDAIAVSDKALEPGTFVLPMPR